MSRKQCELCYCYQDEPLSMFCDECKDKAARYDIVEHNLKMLVKAVQQARNEFTEAMKEETSEGRTTILITSAIARLNLAKQIYGDKYDNQTIT